MTQPKVSIITPSFNQGRYIEQTIQSILNQDYPNIEHIVIDGASTDNTVEILRKYEGKYDLTWVSEPDRGQTHAINKGLRKASGEIVTWINSDDILLSGAVTAIVRKFTDSPETGFVYGNYKIIYKNGNLLLDRKTVSFDKNILLYGRSLIAQPASFFRRSVIDKIGYLDEDYDFCMDIEFWIRAVLNDIVFEHIDEILAAQRLHLDAKTMKIRWKLEQQHRSILNNLNLLFVKKPDVLNKTIFSFLKFIYRTKASVKRMVLYGDFRVFATNIARQKATKK